MRVCFVRGTLGSSDSGPCVYAGSVWELLALVGHLTERWSCTGCALKRPVKFRVVHDASCAGSGMAMESQRGFYPGTWFSQQRLVKWPLYARAQFPVLGIQH